MSPAASIVPGDPFDEFSFLHEQAAAQRRPAPSARRVAIDLADGRALSALAYGEARPRVVLLHGAGLNAHTWDSTVIALGIPALAVDLAGHGDSSWREDAVYAPRGLAEDVAAGIEAWADAPVVLVGQSLGGLTAAALAAARPDLVSRVVVVDITPAVTALGGPEELRRFYEETVFDTREQIVERAVAFGLGGSLDQARRGVLLNTRVREDGRAEWKHHYARLLSPAGADEAPKALAFSPADGWADLAGTEAPLTLVRGTSGYLSDADAAEFADRLPSANVVAIDAPHNVQEVAFDDLAALIAPLAAPAGAAPEGTPSA
ncbi:alpha/beta hydrolase [Microbacterium betulae]|uniref:Alpha/beta hydrolase n=1 Tax=Microbacterium betulae TaxID=2981139 RepID=A0AA97I656_9MICO|nr:alpha/beta hydrolase [Microbacterium sp. AB]WOF22155.1 alpha/beta hydrolase [Microbacterium sp. AB]